LPSQIRCACGTELKEIRLKHPLIIRWEDSRLREKELIYRMFLCHKCGRGYTIQLRGGVYNNRCWKCGKEIDSRVSAIRCAKCGYFICPHDGAHRRGCDGKPNININCDTIGQVSA